MRKVLCVCKGEITMPKMKVWNGTRWITLDANDADTVDGKHASDFASSSHVGSGGSAHAVATTSVAGFMSASDKSKLDGIQAGAEVNQNAFTTVRVGSIDVVADAKTDVLELVAGTNITLTPDSVNDRITISTPAEVNQNAFTTVRVGSIDVVADAKTDVLELVAGTNITLTPDSVNDRITISTPAEVNQNAFSIIKVEKTNIASTSKTDTFELVAGSEIVLTPDSTNKRTTIAVNTTSAGGTEANKVAKTNASGRVGDSERVGGQALADLDNRYVPLAVSSETQPPSPKEGMLWFKPSTGETKAFLNGSFREIAETASKFTNINLNIIDMAVELETLKGATLNGVTANIFIETFTNLNDINLMNGVYDSVNKRLVV